MAVGAGPLVGNTIGSANEMFRWLLRLTGSPNDGYSNWPFQASGFRGHGLAFRHRLAARHENEVADNGSHALRDLQRGASHTGASCLVVSHQVRQVRRVRLLTESPS
jgi:hypothetical protein